nr:helix-turn-helix transcriptional regulator [Sneathiella chinensis]
MSYDYSTDWQDAYESDHDVGQGAGHNVIRWNEISRQSGPATARKPAHQETGLRGGLRFRRPDLYNAALRVLYTLTPAILILDTDRRVIFANREAETYLEQATVVGLDQWGRLYCKDQKAQECLQAYLEAQGDEAGSDGTIVEDSFLLPKADEWPMVAMLGRDQLDALTSGDTGLDGDGHVTLMIRDPNGRQPEQARRLVNYFGLSRAEASVVGELASGASTEEIGRKRGVSVITIRNQIKSAQSKMGVTRQSELVSMALNYM